MIIDTTLQFCTQASVVAPTGTNLIGSQVDTAFGGQLETDDLYLTIMVTTAIVAAGAGTIRFQLASDSTAAIATNGTAAVVTQSGDYVTSTSGTLIPAGSILFVSPLPRATGVYNANKRFLGILTVVGGNAITAGAVSAFMTSDTGRWAPMLVAAN